MQYLNLEDTKMMNFIFGLNISTGELIVYTDLPDGS